MLPDQKQSLSTNSVEQPKGGVVSQPSGASIPKPIQKEESRFLSFEDVLAQKGRETPEDLKAGIRLLRTYQSDVAEAMKGDNGSLVKMAMAENERRDKERDEMTKRLMEEKVVQAKPTPQTIVGEQDTPITPLVTPYIEKTLSTPESRNLESLAKTLERGADVDSITENISIPTSAESQMSQYAVGEGLVRPASSGRVGTSVDEVRKSHFMLPLVLSVFFFVIGMGALYVVFTANKTITPQEQSTVLPVSFSNYQSKVLTDGFTKAQLMSSVDSLRTGTIYTAGSLLNIVLVDTDPTLTKDGKHKERLIETSGLFSFLGTRASPSFIRSLDPQFVLGIHFIKKGEPFLILKTSYYDSSFSGMLDWEKTMAPDLLGLFTKAKSTTDNSISIGEKSGDWNNLFEDEVVKNKDIRVLKDSTNTTVLLYSFINKETLIITTNEQTFNEVYDRLTISSFKR
jgi:hypothetical protein